MTTQMHQLIAGVDEAGRGPLAGAVVAAAVILDPLNPIVGLNDSKLLSEKKRELLFTLIQEKALAWAIGRAEAHEIDQINILQATLLAMQRAIAGLKIIPTLALIDGNCAPKLACETRTIIQGDKTEPAISAASILAKVTRDREMLVLDQEFPQYGFAKHKGYPTKDHLAALEAHGISVIHRRSYAPVARYLPK
ncbi:MAG: ribonuclease HII [Gammaproteobacteria bacterium]|nr:ribonuclease HII [Gammaproteobacteria bacterium]